MFNILSTHLSHSKPYQIQTNWITFSCYIVLLMTIVKTFHWSGHLTLFYWSHYCLRCLLIWMLNLWYCYLYLFLSHVCQSGWERISCVHCWIFFHKINFLHNYTFKLLFKIEKKYLNMANLIIDSWNLFHMERGGHSENQKIHWCLCLIIRVDASGNTTKLTNRHAILH